MTNYLFISGSPRPGNNETIMQHLFHELLNSSNSDLIDAVILYPRSDDIKRCVGCLKCQDANETNYSEICAIRDGMSKNLDLMTQADVIIMSTPNYCDNVSGLLKDFIDRLNPLYHKNLLEGKKLVAIVVGGGQEEHSERIVQENGGLFALADSYKMNLVSSYIFKALHINDISEDIARGKESRILPELEKIIDTLEALAE
jgi:multimeric flavodoxin WrbA